MRSNTSIRLSDDSRKRAIASIRRYVTENLEEQIGDLKATLLLDYVLAELGPSIYNQAIADARAFFMERSSDLDAVCYHAEFPFWSKAPRAVQSDDTDATA